MSGFKVFPGFPSLQILMVVLVLSWFKISWAEWSSKDDRCLIDGESCIRDIECCSLSCVEETGPVAEGGRSEEFSFQSSGRGMCIRNEPTRMQKAARRTRRPTKTTTPRPTTTTTTTPRPTTTTTTTPRPTTTVNPDCFWSECRGVNTANCPAGHHQPDGGYREDPCGDDGSVQTLCCKDK